MTALFRSALVGALSLAVMVLCAPPSWSRAVPSTQSALRVTETRPGHKAPWPAKTLVLAWIDGKGGRLYPLPLLDRHGVILDERSGRRVAATWSVEGATAVLLALPSQLTPLPTQDDTQGWRHVHDPTRKSSWLPGRPEAIEGPAPQRLDPVPEAVVSTLRLARRLAPDAEIVVSSEPPAKVNAAWQVTRRERLAPTLTERLTVVLARNGASAWRHGALPRDGIIRTEIAGLATLVVRAHYVTRAFMAPLTPTRQVAVDPWTGAPLLWTEGIGLWNGLTGTRLDNDQTATQALTVIELNEAAFKGQWPSSPIHAAKAP